jgi:molybdopterin synthase sulfur carrier subunit
MAELRLPRTLTPLYADLPRRVEVDAPTVVAALDELERRWPGLRDRLCDPGPALRQHIHVYVDHERATLETPIDERSEVLVVAAISGG